MPRIARGLATAVLTTLVIVSATPFLASAALAVAPPVASVTAVAGDGSVTIRWTNPTGSTATSLEVRYLAGLVAPAAVTDGLGVPVAAGASSARVSHLANGQPYTFVVFATDADGATPSSPVSATPAAPQTAGASVTLTLSRPVVGPGVRHPSAVLTATVTGADNAPVAGVRVRVETSPAGQTAWTAIGTLTTSTAGRVTRSVAPRGAVLYRAILLPVGGAPQVVSAPTTIAYAPLLALNVPDVARTRTPIVVSGALRALGKGHAVDIQVSRGGRTWRTAASLTTGSGGAFSFTWTETAPASLRIRAVAPANARHRAAASSTFALTVMLRDLRAGMSGDDVLALQRRLAALHYDTGAVNGKFGADLVHAVVPFQKLNGLPRTGVVDIATMKALAHPTIPVPTHLVAHGRSVEVDKSLQVGVFYQDGQVYRILDVSTGSERHYVQEGQKLVAHTPEGSFTINRKIDGLRKSKLGLLWRPSYFHLGYAIHGASEVPAYAASHGCVRITNAAANRYFGWLVVGTRVFVYK